MGMRTEAAKTIEARLAQWLVFVPKDVQKRITKDLLAELEAGGVFDLPGRRTPEQKAAYREYMRKLQRRLRAEKTAHENVGD